MVALLIIAPNLNSLDAICDFYVGRLITAHDNLYVKVRRKFHFNWLEAFAHRELELECFRRFGTN